jgi:NAD(P)-dependent dehydrogenase (short-subunit alcohol dehydrogenase family)
MNQGTMELRDRVAVITGGGTGIGRATAQLFAREGARVLLAGRREEPLRRTADEIVVAGGQAAWKRTDITDDAQVRALMAEAVSAYGGIDILVNNAGVFLKGKAAHEFSMAEWMTAMDVNWKGTLLCSIHAIEHLKARGGGAIINCTSVSARVAQRMQAPYNTAKAAIDMMSRCTALELGQFGIRVNTICPSMTETDMAAPAIARSGRERIAESHPIARLGMPEDTAQAALYLASPRASWVSGTALFVDGGYSCR